jgi:16S rRNA (guanine527-N7)-methyltransferase
MEIGSSEWQEFIQHGAQKMGIAIDERIGAAFSTFASELIQWNRKINLTAITHPHDIAIKHFLDSLASAAFIPEQAKLLDIGSGGGFPGIPLKLSKPLLSILLIDGNRKKVNFLKHVVRILKLEGCEARHIRAEKLSENPEFRHTFDVVISRALSDLKSFIEIARPLVSKQGMMVAMKGEIDPAELDSVRAMIGPDRYQVDIRTYRLPTIPAQRSVVIVRSLL